MTRHIRDLQASQGLNYLVHGLAWNAHGLWCLGYPQKALVSGCKQAIEFAREFEQPFNQALAITYMAMLQEWCADPDTFRQHAEDASGFRQQIQSSLLSGLGQYPGMLCPSTAAAWQRRCRAAAMARSVPLPKPAHMCACPFTSPCWRAPASEPARSIEGLEAIELGLTESLPERRALVGRRTPPPARRIDLVAGRRGR